jgi:hypothetical protein
MKEEVHTTSWRRA